MTLMPAGGNKLVPVFDLLYGNSVLRHAPAVGSEPSTFVLCTANHTNNRVSRSWLYQKDVNMH